MKKSVLVWITSAVLVVVSGFVPTSRVNAAPSLLDECVTNIGDPLFDKAFLLNMMVFMDVRAYR